MKLRHIPSILIALAAIFPTACGNSHSGHDHSGHDHNEEAEHAKEHDGGEKKTISMKVRSPSPMRLRSSPD